jgi:hypothetical protein
MKKIGIKQPSVFSFTPLKTWISTTQVFLNVVVDVRKPSQWATKVIF